MASSIFSRLFSRRSRPTWEAPIFGERRFRALVEHGTEIITLVDEHFMPLYRSPASTRLTGWSTKERLENGIIEQTHPDDLAGLHATLDQVLQNPGKSFRISFRTLHKQGHYVWLEGNAINLLEDESVRAIVTNLHDITESKAAENQLKESHEELRLLASHLQDIREEERTAMAREIHDELGQQLTGLKMDVSWLSRRPDLNDDATRQKIKGILSLLDVTVSTVRRLAAELRPAILDDLGLPEAMEWHCKQFSDRFGIHCAIDVVGGGAALPPGVATGLFRILQEALTNVARHSKATSVSARLDIRADRADLVISDDGKGFDVHHIIGTKKTLGLLGMKERALMLGGKCDWASEPGRGTTIRVSVPLSKDPLQTKQTS
jgi:PAS domain S-box-containing protein